VSAQPPLLRLSHVSKHFGGVQALRDASLTLKARGVVHGLIGQNGSGKSTLLNILSGQVAPDRGTIELDGVEVGFRDPTQAADQGLAVVSQETALAADLSIAENVLLGPRLVRARGRVDWGASRRLAQSYTESLGLDRDPNTPVRLLRPDEQQLVEIARALSMDVRILILDEPTSSLSEVEVARLFTTMRALTERDVSILFVTHRLAELTEISDELTVLRDGSTISAGPMRDFDIGRIVSDMVGERVSASEGVILAGPRTPKETTGAAPPRTGFPLRVEGLAARPIRSVSLEVEPGEIVGIAGLVGAGRSELLETLFGLRRRESGRVTLGDREVAPRNPREAIDAGFGYVPPDRKNRGVLLQRTVHENLSIVARKDRPWWRRGQSKQDRVSTAKLSRELDIRGAGLDTEASALSGGNQQKLVIAKWLIAEPKCLLLDEPMRGVDVAAKKEIFEILRDAADRGIGILMSSSENEELLAASDRILIMVGGTITSAVAPDLSDEAELTRLTGGF
jgi:ABC-type sugar transport system ATPase subunit